MPYTFNPFTGNFDSAPSVPAVEGVYLPLSGGTVTGNLSVEGNFEVGSNLPTATMILSGNKVGINTETPNEELTVVGDISATGGLNVGNQAGTSTLYVGNTFVGVNTETPNEELTVVGDISATAVMYAFGGNSNIWNESYSLIQSNSASWVSDSTVDTGVRALTSNWESTYTTVLGNSASWVNTLSAQTAEVLIAKVYNADTTTMVKGNVVYTFGATGDVMSVKLASNLSDATSSKTLGLVNETIAPNAIGYVVIAGQIDKMSLPHQTFAEGDALWLGSTNGTFTNVKPTAPNHGVYLGVVERANNGDGLVYVKVQNGYELDELHDVLITSVSANQILRRNNINNLWINTDDGTKWDSTYTIVETNSSTNWNNDVVRTYVDTNFVPLSGGTVTGSLSVLGNITYIDTSVAVTSAMYIDTTSSETALRITQKGPGDVIRVEDEPNPDSTPFIVKSDGLVGMGTANPNERLTVVGNISSTGIVYASGGNSGNWNSTFTAVQTNSATWDAGFSVASTLSADSIGTTWTAVPSAFYAINWTSVVYGNGIFVASHSGSTTNPLITANNNKLAVSYDGYSWFSTTTPISRLISDIVYGNGLFVAVRSVSTGVDSEIVYSADGINWTKIEGAPTNAQFRGVVYGNGKFVAVTDAFGLGPSSLISYDGIRWQIYDQSSNWSNILDLVYGNGIFVVPGNGSSSVYVSQDGITWTEHFIDPPSLLSLVHGKGKFVGISIDDYTVYHSVNGIDWIQNSSIVGNNASKLVYGNGTFVLTNLNSTTTPSQVAISKDGINWRIVNHQQTPRWYSIGYGNGTFVAMLSGGGIMASGGSIDPQAPNSNIGTVDVNTPGLSAVTTIVAVSAIPVVQVPGTLYILI